MKQIPPFHGMAVVSHLICFSGVHGPVGIVVHQFVDAADCLEAQPWVFIVTQLWVNHAQIYSTRTRTCVLHGHCYHCDCFPPPGHRLLHNTCSFQSWISQIAAVNLCQQWAFMIICQVTTSVNTADFKQIRGRNSWLHLVISVSREFLHEQMLC